MNRNSLLLAFGALVIIGLISTLFFFSSIQAYPWEEKGLKTYTIELYNCSEIATDTNDALNEEFKSIFSASKIGINSNEFVIPVAKIIVENDKKDIKFGIPLFGFTLIRIKSAPDAFFYEDRQQQEEDFWNLDATSDKTFLKFRREIIKRHFKNEGLVEAKLKTIDWWQDTLREFVVNLAQTQPHIKKKSFSSYSELKKHLNSILETNSSVLVGKSIKVFYLCGAEQVAPPCLSDKDGDGVCDEDDDCVNEFGPKENKGCKCNQGDRDGDGVCDENDNCIDVKGVAPDGCPLADRDQDGVPDVNDKCPNQRGTPPTGCPCKDKDNDGYCDDLDKCPDIPGKQKGCPPDFDGDGVFDDKDRCNGLKGGPPFGCPNVEIDLVEIPGTILMQIKAKVDGIVTEEQMSSFSLKLTFQAINGNTKSTGNISGLSSHSIEGQNKLAIIYSDGSLFGTPPQTGMVDITAELYWGKNGVRMAKKEFSNIKYMCSIKNLCGFQN
jgi:hypothetical protein